MSHMVEAGRSKIRILVPHDGIFSNSAEIERLGLAKTNTPPPLSMRSWG